MFMFDSSPFAFIFADEDLGGVEIHLVADGQTLDERHIGIGGPVLSQPDFLDEAVQPQTDRGVTHPVLSRHLLEGTGGQKKAADERHILLIQLRHPFRYNGN